MKVVTAKEMARTESLAYADGASEETFMENAGAGIASLVDERHLFSENEKQITLLCGKGNNAGDAYVAGSLLKQKGYQTKALQLAPIDSCSPLCQKNHQRFIDCGGIVQTIEENDTLNLPDTGLILDGIFGTGFRGEVKGCFAKAIEAANQSGLPIYAIDIPSGLNGNTGEAGNLAIKAAVTIFLGLPKTGFFIEKGWNLTGKLHYVNFGLSDKYIAKAQENFNLITHDFAKTHIPPIVRNRHKYQAGYVVGLGGSPGMPGAAILAGYAALRGGCGIVRLLHPDGMQTELSNSPYELIKQAYTPDDPSPVVEALNSASATFVGPGIGTSPEMQNLLQAVLPQLEKPCVLDADALNILSQTEIALPQQSILTPHIGEMHRLLKLKDKMPISLDLLDLCQQYCEQNSVALILKGSPSFVFTPDTVPMVNPFGDPGMATAGSGDVLTGIAAALLAQGLSPKDAACLSVYLHAIAGENAARKLSSRSLVASDIIEALPSVFSRSP